MSFNSAYIPAEKGNVIWGSAERDARRKSLKASKDAVGIFATPLQTTLAITTSRSKQVTVVL